MRILPIGSVLVTLCVVPALFGQSFDTSGTSLLQGTYFVRQVLYDQFNAGYAPTRGTAFTGTVTFDGSGKYTLTGQMSVSTTSSGAPQSFTSSGAYAVSANGVLRMDDPLSSGDALFGGVGNSAIVASATESANVLDLMIGVPIGSSASNASLSGQYRVGAMDVTGASVTQTRNASFQINADGNGNLGTVSLLGQAANNSDTEVTQSVSGATYSINGSNNSMTFPLASGASATSQLVSGSKSFAVSSDGNVFIGGGLNSYDMIVGIKSGSGGNGTYSGTYFSGGMDYDNSQASSSQYYFDTFYGSVNANGAGTSIAHQRVAPSNSYTYDYTVDDEFTVSGGTVTENYARFFVGAGGTAVLAVGRSTAYSLELSVAAKYMAPTGSVTLSPIGVLNAANYTPITNPVTPGEMVLLFGSGLASSTATASSVPFPTSLGNVTVTVNGTAAPLYSVSPTEIVAIVPWEIDPNSVGYAQFQVKNGGGTSNTVTLFVDTAAPGVFTLTQNGVFDAAALHANGNVVSSKSPALIGETISVFATGMGIVSPTIGDGAAAPSSPLSSATDSFSVYIDGNQATPSFAGLAPGFVGLYQINVAVPTGTSNGEVYMDISDDSNGAYNSMATLSVGSGATAAAVPSSRLHVRARVAASRKGFKSSMQAHSKRAGF